MNVPNRRERVMRALQSLRVPGSYLERVRTSAGDQYYAGGSLVLQAIAIEIIRRKMVMPNGTPNRYMITPAGAEAMRELTEEQEAERRHKHERQRRARMCARDARAALEDAEDMYA